MESETKPVEPDSGNGVQLTLGDFSTRDWEAVLITAKKPVCSLYSTLFFQKAGEMFNAGDEVGGKVFRFLGAAASMALRNEGRKTPFKPQFILETRRSTILGDFTSEELGIVAVLLQSTKDPAMRARFGDMLWVTQKDHKAARIAAEAYLEHFQRLNIAEDWAWDIESIHRGLALAYILGKKAELFQKYADYLQKLLILHSPLPNGGPCLKLVGMLLEYEIGDPSSHGKIMDEMAARFECCNDFYRAKRYFEEAIRCHAAAENEVSARASQRRKGECLIREAHAAVNSKGQGYIAGTHFLALAIECLRQAHAAESVIEPLHLKLREWQKSSLSELGKISHDVDISQSVEAAIAMVRGKSLFDAIMAFTLRHPLINLKTLRARVLANARDFPVSHMFGATFLSHDGRVMAHKAPVTGLENDVYDPAVVAEMISQAKMVDLPLRAVGLVGPCRKQIWDEHLPSEADLSFLVTDNPVIPPGHELLFLRGIKAGFEDDMVVSAHILIPQIEEAIRYVLGRSGVVTSKLDSKLVQEERSLGILLEMPETTHIFGESTIFELRALLVEKFGFDLRNRLAHGFLTAPECFGFDVGLVWWWAIRLCAYPVFRASRTEMKPEVPKTDSADEGNA